jgi:hypothetical protein
MDKETYDLAKKQLDEVTEHLKGDDLTIEQREELEILQAKLSGGLLSIWFPMGIGRKLIMVVIFLVGIYGLVIGNHYFLFSWIILPMFSPRLMGEVSYFMGRISAGTRGTG